MVYHHTFHAADVEQIFDLMRSWSKEAQQKGTTPPVKTSNGVDSIKFLYLGLGREINVILSLLSRGLRK